MTSDRSLLVSLNCDHVSSHMDLSQKILSDPINQWLFSHVRQDIFLVGGYIRDLIHKGYINKDKDYVLKGNVKGIALGASKKFKGTPIELKKNQMVRVALKDGQFLDFSKMQGLISEDLRKRDFRINAIAWSPEKGLIDPFEGMTDIKNKVIRIIDPKNLAEDPLRVLRAYRLAAQLRFTIDMDTRGYLRKYALNLTETAAERITEELFKLLMTDDVSYYLSLCAKDKVLLGILNVTNYKLKQNMSMLVRFDHFIERIRSGKFKNLVGSRILPALNLNIGQGLNRVGLIRLSILLNNLHRAGENQYARLKTSNSILKSVMKIQDGIRLGTGRITVGKLYDIFNAADDCVLEAALLVSVTRQKNVDKFLKRSDDFIKTKNNPLLDGHEIQNILNINPTPLIGKIQAEIQRRRFLGITRTKTEASHWIRSNFT